MTALKYASEIDYITIPDKKEGEKFFVELAGIVHKGKFYNVLKPKTENEPPEVYAVKTKRGKECYKLVRRKKTIDAVMTEYHNMLEEISR